MPKGLTNAPAAFQRFMNDTFADMIDINVVVYLDDILIYSDGLPEHITHVQEVLRRLRINGLFAQADKCKFHVTSCKYLGYMLSPEGLTMASNKVQIIQDWPEPWKVKDIQSFLGFTSFYHHFIHEYTPITVETDASDYALAAVLSIMTPTGKLHPVAFHSCTFHELEHNYDVHDKELLTIFEAFTQWRHYLEGSGTPIDVITDHWNLQYFSMTKILMHRQARWSEYLSRFNLVIHFHPGKLGMKPDKLTRQ